MANGTITSPFNPDLTQPAASGVNPQLAQICSPPANLLTPGDSVVQTISDGAGGATCVFASGASYYFSANGDWTYIDAQNNSYSGDAQGNYCDSFGNCTPGWTTSGIPTWVWYVGAGALVLALFMGRGRR